MNTSRTVENILTSADRNGFAADTTTNPVTLTNETHRITMQLTATGSINLAVLATVNGETLATVGSRDAGKANTVASWVIDYGQTSIRGEHDFVWEDEANARTSSTNDTNTEDFNRAAATALAIAATNDEYDAATVDNAMERLQRAGYASDMPVWVTHVLAVDETATQDGAVVTRDGATDYLVEVSASMSGYRIVPTSFAYDNNFKAMQSVEGSWSVISNATGEAWTREYFTVAGALADILINCHSKPAQVSPDGFTYSDVTEGIFNVDGETTRVSVLGDPMFGEFVTTGGMIITGDDAYRFTFASADDKARFIDWETRQTAAQPVSLIKAHTTVESLAPWEQELMDAARTDEVIDRLTANAAHHEHMARLEFFYSISHSDAKITDEFELWTEFTTVDARSFYGVLIDVLYHGRSASDVIALVAAERPADKRTANENAAQADIRNAVANIGLMITNARNSLRIDSDGARVLRKAFGRAGVVMSERAEYAAAV